MASADGFTWLYGGGFLQAFAQVAGVYYLAAAGLHWGLPLVLRDRKLHPPAASGAEMRRDAASSLAPLAIRAAALAATDALRAAGASRAYAGPMRGAPALAALVLTILLLDLLHDAYFYWAHRLLHLPWLLRHVHHVHHRSSHPTTFSGYAFHPLEAALVFALYPLETLVLPLPAGVHRLYHLYTMVLHLGGHCGHEAAPFIPTLEWGAWGGARLLLRAARAARAALAGSQPASGAARAGTAGTNAVACATKALAPGNDSAAAGDEPVPAGLNTVMHHDLHHRYPRHHFSLYFTHWDRWCGTLHPGYDVAAAAFARGGRDPIRGPPGAGGRAPRGAGKRL